MIHMQKQRGPPPGVAPRVVITILFFIAWLVFILLFSIFYMSEFTIIQSVIIIFVSFLIVGSVIGLMWAYWGIKVGYRHAEKYRRIPRKRKIR